VIFGSSRILGLAVVSERQIVCAEIGSRSGRPVVRAQGVFTLPPDLSAEQPVAVGDALTKFLRQHGFSSSRAVVGVPAKFLMAVEKEVPPAEQQQLDAMLRLQTERMNTGDGGEMVFDYAGAADRARGGKVLLVGVLRRQLDRIRQIMDAAGLSIVAVTSTGLAVASAMKFVSGSGDSESSILLLSRQGGEMIWRHQGVARALRHLPLAAVNGEGLVAVAAVGSELRRAVAMSPLAAATNGQAPGGGSEREIVLWDLLGLEAREVEELSAKLGLKVRSASAASALGLHTNGELGGTDAAQSAQFAPAISLALAGVRRELPVDLAHSRLAPPPQRRISRTVALSVATAAVVVIGIGSLIYDVKSRQSELADLQAEMAGWKNQIKDAETNVARFDFGRGFYDKRTPVLQCLRELTAAFRDDEPMWVTSFKLSENGTGQLSGKAAEQRYVVQLYDRLQKNPKFTGVTAPDLRDAGDRTREKSFTINFNFTATE
jgi:hypothetical protein